MVNSRIILTAFLTIGTVVLAVPIVPDGSAGAGTPEGGPEVGFSEPGLPVRTRQLHNDTTQGPPSIEKNWSSTRQLWSFQRRARDTAKLTYSERIIYLRRQSSLPEKYKGVVDAAAALVPVGSGSPTMRVDLDTAREHGKNLSYLYNIFTRYVEKDGASLCPSGTSPEKLAKIRQGFEQGEDLRKLMDIATAKPSGSLAMHPGRSVVVLLLQATIIESVINDYQIPSVHACSILSALLVVGTVVLAVPIVPEGIADTGMPEGGARRINSVSQSEPDTMMIFRADPHLPKAGLAHNHQGHFNVVILKTYIQGAGPSGTSPEKLAKIRQAFKEGEDLNKIEVIEKSQAQQTLVMHHGTRRRAFSSSDDYSFDTSMAQWQQRRLNQT
ncbi:hypothetical protein EV359DRAFT_80514 [Lentinula novae-zelandiae]|nr:hypothetical protein EV359DRAFT_80514 [Lentinula novae-zelandiae]